MSATPCGCECGELIDPRRGKKYVDAKHRLRAHRKRYEHRLTGPFWAGYREVRRSRSQRRDALRAQPSA
jgi:hypothetical protein